MEKPAEFQIFEGKNDQWYWRLVAGNGQVMAQSEGYVSHYNAKRAVQRFIEIVPHAEVVSLNPPEDE